MLLCCYDHPLPAPLAEVRPTGGPFGAALVLAPAGSGPLLAACFRPDPAAPALLPAPPGNGLARNPAARALPLLAALARAGPDRHALPYLRGHVSVELAP